MPLKEDLGLLVGLVAVVAGGSRSAEYDAHWLRGSGCDDQANAAEKRREECEALEVTIRQGILRRLARGE